VGIRILVSIQVVIFLIFLFFQFIHYDCNVTILEYDYLLH